MVDSILLPKWRIIVILRSLFSQTDRGVKGLKGPEQAEEASHFSTKLFWHI